MDQLIPIASKLQDVLGAVGQNTQLDLPQIVVVRLLRGKTMVKCCFVLFHLCLYE
jgi:hypothetical protein